MRIAFYSPNYPGVNVEGGIGTYTAEMARGLCANGHEVHVLTPGDGASITDGPVSVRTVKTTYIRVVDRVLPGAGTCWRIYRAIQDLRRLAPLDIVEFPNWEGFGIATRAFTNIPVVTRLYTSSAEAQQIDGQAPKRWQRWDVRRERWQALSANYTVTHSVAHRKMMALEYGCAEDQIDIVPLGVRTFPLFPRERPKASAPSVVYLGRLEHRKGTVELLQAIPKVLEVVPEARFTLIGADRPHAPGGRTHAQYLEQEFSPAVRQAITLAGRLGDAEVDRQLQSADLFVAPSRYESFGLIFLEAMRWGTPVLGTTAGGIPEIVEHGKSGWLVPPQAPEELARALVLLLQNPSLRHSLGHSGRARAESEFSVETMVTRMEGRYRELMTRRGRRK